MEPPTDFWTLYIYIPCAINLFTTFVGIVFTYLIVEKIINNVEKKRWAISKQAVYAKLFRSSSELLASIVPDNFRGRVKRICLFGNRIPIIYYEYQNLTRDDIFWSLSENERCSLGNLVFKTKESVARFLEEINEISYNNGYIIDPDFQERLSVLDVLLTTFTDDSDENPSDPAENSVEYQELVSSILNFRAFLSKDAKRMSKSEYVRGIFSRKYGYYSEVAKEAF